MFCALAQPFAIIRLKTSHLANGTQVSEEVLCVSEYHFWCHCIAFFTFQTALKLSALDNYDSRCYNVGVYCDQRKCKCEDCRNYPGYHEEDHEERLEEDLDSRPLRYVDVPTNAHTLHAAVAHSSQSVSASSGSTSTDSVVADKRVRHSQRTSRRRNKPQDFSQYYLGSPSPMRPPGTYEQV